MRLPVPPETRTHPSHVTADVAVVGGGPVGCATALAFAESGARVCLIDANAPSGRLAGEWLHPTGVGVLTDLGVDLTAAGVPHSPGRGFANRRGSWTGSALYPARVARAPGSL